MKGLLTHDRKSTLRWVVNVMELNALIGVDTDRTQSF